jgi:hypothetical protein
MTAVERAFQLARARALMGIAALLVALLLALSIVYGPPIFPNNDHSWMAYYTMKAATSGYLRTRDCPPHLPDAKSTSNLGWWKTLIQQGIVRM